MHTLVVSIELSNCHHHVNLWSRWLLIFTPMLGAPSLWCLASLGRGYFITASYLDSIHMYGLWMRKKPPIRRSSKSLQARKNFDRNCDKDFSFYVITSCWWDWRCCSLNLSFVSECPAVYLVIALMAWMLLISSGWTKRSNNIFVSQQDEGSRSCYTLALSAV